MREKSVKCKRVMLVLLLAFVVTALLLVGTTIAVTHTEVESVTRSLSDVVEPNAEFDVMLTINYEELPLVVGIVETIPEGYSFVSCPTEIPTEQCRLSEDKHKVAFTVICKEGEPTIDEITYRVKAPSAGRGTFEGEFVDLLVQTSTLPEEEGKEGRWHTIGGETMNRVRAVGEGTGTIEEGATATPTPTPYVPAVTKATRVVPVMEAGKEVAMTFKDMDVSMLTLKADANASNVEVKIERVERTPDIPEPPGTAYMYFDIEVKNPGAAKIEGKVEFKVAKSWIAADNIDEATVKLNRYDESRGEWKALPTHKTGEDNATVYFEAETPGFSLFGVTGEKKVEVETAAAATPTPTTAVAAATPAAAPAATPASTPVSKTPSFEMIFAVVALLIVYTMVYRKKRRKGRWHVRK
ncbi:MAG: PGF-pre-PGF domain-containing protein [Methanophagales archaeon]|nr:PGF-pre-PGF domain-containing protein [Methanophagales archaeon]